MPGPSHRMAAGAARTANKGSMQAGSIGTRGEVFRKKMLSRGEALAYLALHGVGAADRRRRLWLLHWRGVSACCTQARIMRAGASHLSPAA